MIFSLLILGIDFGITAPKATREALLTSKNELDITFRVQGQLIPAHKQVLTEKSRYFYKAFNSGMAESRQDIIEIEDCEYEVFKEFLRWIYQATAAYGDIDRTMKLLTLADKYLQEDLCEKCIYSLVFRINMENIYKILDFAHEKDIPQIKTWCLKHFKEKITIHNVANLIEYLDHQVEFKEDNKELRNFSLSFVLKSFVYISCKEKGNCSSMKALFSKTLIWTQLQIWRSL